MKEEVPPLQNKFACATLKINSYNVGCTYCQVSLIMPSMFHGFTSADNLQQMAIAILNRFCLIYFLSVHLIISAEAKHIHVFQKPRFLGVKTDQNVMIFCVSSQSSMPARVVWFKDRADKDTLKNSQRIYIKEKSEKTNASILIKKVEVEDSGIYFCKLNDTLGPGTALQVSSK